MTESQPFVSVAPSSRRERDIRLDFFRGLAMFIIFVAHVPGNPWFGYIPARFGFSSAAELFVFCSGVASGFAFGGAFLRRGAVEGSKRILKRIWQVYWAHIFLFLSMTGTSIIGFWLTGTDYPLRLGIAGFVAAPGEGMLRLMTLRFIPDFNDILPLYLVLLAMIIPVMMLAHIRPWLAMGLLFCLWIFAHRTHFNLPAGNIYGTDWYFSPFAWQLMFFTGFSFALGWLPMPTLRKGRLFWFCVAFLIISVPLNFWAIVENVPWIENFRNTILPEGNQMYLNPLRYSHFLALAYVVLVLVEDHRETLSKARLIVGVGQQSLPTFLASTSLVWIAGMVLDASGRGIVAVTLVNLTGFAMIIAVSRVMIRLKRAA